MKKKVIQLVRRLESPCLFAFFGSAFLFFSALSLWRYNSGQLFYWDFGHYSRILWLMSRLLPPIIPHKVLGNILFLGDHFAPGMALLAPLYWFSSKPPILLLEQVLATVGAGIIIYKIGKAMRLSSLAAWAVSFVFLLFAGVENPLVTDWHTESTSVLFLALFLYWFLTGKRMLLPTIAALLFISLKDSNPLSLFFLLIPLFFAYPKQRAYVLFLALFSLAAFGLIAYVITPLISKQPYLYSPVLPNQPIEFMTQFFNQDIKRKLLFDSFASFGFVPLLSGFFLLPIIGELSIRLVPTYLHSQSFTLGMHYNVYLGFFLALASMHGIIAFGHVFRHHKKQIGIWLACFLVVAAVVTAKKITHPPALLAFNTVFWKEWNVKNDLFQKIHYIPQRGSIMAQNNILPLVLARKEPIYLLSYSYAASLPDVIVLDLGKGQNPNNFYSGELNSEDHAIRLKTILEDDARYERIRTPYPSLYVFRKVTATHTIQPDKPRSE